MKVLLFTHESDIDGLGNLVLAKLAFKDLDYILCPGFKDLESKFRECLSNGTLLPYDRIYITDLALHHPALTMLDNDENLNKKVLIFDHHAGSLDEGCGIYDYETITELDELGNKTCGTKLFYEHLINNGYLIQKTILDEFVELTRLEDTWEWKQKGDFGIKAHDLAILFNSINNREEYTSRMLTKINNDETIKYNEEELNIIQNKKDEYERALKETLEDSIILIDENGNKFCAVFAKYEYRNELTEYIEKIGNPEGIKYIIVVAMDKGLNGQKSYRTIGTGTDVNEIAVAHGGGGHPEAACVVITEEQKEHAKTLTKKDALTYLVNSKYTNK